MKAWGKPRTAKGLERAGGGALGLSAFAISLATSSCLWGFEAKDIMAFSAGPVVIHPKLAVTESFNDNIFYSGQNPESAFITGVTPAVDFRLGRPDGDRVFSLNYAFNEYWYHGSPQIDTAQAHAIGFAGTIKGNRLSSETALNLAFLNTIYGGVEAFESGALASSRNIDRTTGDLRETIRLQTTEKTSAYTTFTVQDLDFRTSIPYYDNNTWRILGGFSYKARPKLGLFGEVYYGQSASNPNVTYSNWLDGLPDSLGLYTYTVKPPHFETLGGFAGANLELATRLTGQVKVGYEQSSRDEYVGGGDLFVPGVIDQPFEISTGGSAIDLGAPVASVSLKSSITERTTATLSYNRGTHASVTTSAAAYTRDAFRLQFQQVLGNSRPWFVDLELNLNLNDYAQFDQIYTLNVPGVGSGVVRHPAPAHSSRLMGIKTSLAYQPAPWLVALVGYRYLNQHSDGSSGGGVDYDVNEVYVSVSLGY